MNSSLTAHERADLFLREEGINDRFLLSVARLIQEVRDEELERILKGFLDNPYDINQEIIKQMKESRSSL